MNKLPLPAINDQAFSAPTNFKLHISLCKAVEAKIERFFDQSVDLNGVKRISVAFASKVVKAPNDFRHPIHHLCDFAGCALSHFFCELVFFSMGTQDARVTMNDRERVGHLIDDSGCQLRESRELRSADESRAMSFNEFLRFHQHRDVDGLNGDVSVFEFEDIDMEMPRNFGCDLKGLADLAMTAKIANSFDLRQQHSRRRRQGQSDISKPRLFLRLRLLRLRLASGAAGRAKGP